MQELDSIIARALRVAEFFDGIDPKVIGVSQDAGLCRSA
jgi:hypothetical protein